MKKILVLVAGYPDNNGGISLMYVHTRNVFYKKHGIDVTVLNFGSKSDYIIDDIPVISLSTYEKEHKEYDTLVLHAANIRNHYKFLKKYENRFAKLIFFYHGHEVLKINSVYPPKYSYVKKESSITKLMQDLYDDLKLFLWRHYLPKIAYKSFFVFVSNWMKEEFLKWTKINPDMLENRSSITYNSIDSSFKTCSFDDKIEKKYDFITIRGYLDGSKYCIDVVNRLAKNTPDKKFLVIGKGEFFNHNEKAPNLDWECAHLSHDEIVERLNKAKFALMPTRTDAQGLMMCEMAAFGIPVITSDIPVCHEVFDDFENVYYIDNNNFSENLNNFNDELSKCVKHDKYYMENTVTKEVSLIENQ